MKHYNYYGQVSNYHYIHNHIVNTLNGTREALSSMYFGIQIRPGL